MEKTLFVDSKKTKLGSITVGVGEKGVYFCGFGAAANKIRKSDVPSGFKLVKKATPHTRLALKQLEEYAQGKRQEFDLPLVIEGTPFQKKVWQAMQRIPYGHVTTYGVLAKYAGKPKAARAVGMACNRNPIGIIIPCHRVVGSNGDLTGYAGGLNNKEKLLRLEHQHNDCECC